MNHSQPPSRTSTRLPRPPREPDLDECCGSGCDPCVFDLYEQRFERWRVRCEQIRAQNAREPS